MGWWSQLPLGGFFLQKKYQVDLKIGFLSMMWTEISLIDPEALPL